ncbi:MAG: AmpG family muropeptide MFS transporter [Rhodocyclaceae bacterium]|nr:AmpG family muropeptide MFS transporter [Rhodocyclaceae bacterium]
MTLAMTPTWLSVLLTRRMLICVLTGFASGLPLYLLINLVPAWLRTEGVDLKAIGLLSLAMFPYTWKFLWAPLLDRYALLGLGRRRSWMLLTQIALLAAIAWCGFVSPKGLTAPGIDWVPLFSLDLVMLQINAALPVVNWPSLKAFASHPATIACFSIGFLSATLDIALDAFRREILPDVELGLGNSVHVNAYRIAGLVPGSLSLILSDHMSWQWVFAITAMFMLPGIMMSLMVSEPNIIGKAPPTLRMAIIEPFKEFVGRKGWASAMLVLAFIFLYKLGDSLGSAQATTFYLDMGYSKTDIGLIAKNAGLWGSVVGALLGGLLMLKWNINRALWLFGVVQIVSTLGFAWLASMGQQTTIGLEQQAALALVIVFEALGAGLGGAAFVAYMASNTHPSYTATQLALFTSLMAVPRTLVGASVGWLIEYFGWLDFFLICAMLGIPGMLLLLKVAPWNGSNTPVH